MKKRKIIDYEFFFSEFLENGFASGILEYIPVVWGINFDSPCINIAKFRR